MASSMSITLPVRVEEQAGLDSSRWETGLVKPEHVTNILKFRHAACGVEAPNSLTGQIVSQSFNKLSIISSKTL